MMIDREKAIRILEKCAKEPLKRNADRYVVTLDVRFVNSILELLKEQPELVRCKVCRYLNEDTGVCIVGIPHGYKDTWFCADGKLKEW